jgi:hypothetical protein
MAYVITTFLFEVFVQKDIYPTGPSSFRHLPDSMVLRHVLQFYDARPYKLDCECWTIYNVCTAVGHINRFFL